MSNPKPIPGFSRYGVTTDARIFNLETGQQLRTTADVRGYRFTVLVNDQGERKTVKRHLMVAWTYLVKPNEDAVVNHKDLVPGHDWKDNLEYTTQKANVKHWQENGTVKVSVPVEVMDVETGEITYYPSVGRCSKVLGIGRYSIQGRLERGSDCIWPEGKRYRRAGCADPWPEPRKVSASRARLAVLRDLRTNDTIIFNKLSDTLPYIGYKLAAVWKWATDPCQPVIPGLYQIQLSDQMLPWREVTDVFEELQDGMNCKVVVRYDANWSNPIWYASAKVCCDLNDLKPSGLNYRLKNKGQVVYDGYRYCYYSDLPEDQKKTIRYEVPPEGCVQRPSTATSPLGE